MPELNKNYIAGEWLSGAAEVENRNPSDLSDLIGVYAQANSDQVTRALESAATAQRQWAASGLEQRYSVLMSIGQELMARSDELGTLLAREEGKPFAEGKGEVYRAGQFFTYYAAESLRQIGDNADSVRDNIEVDVRREPVGVVAIISPWNFPTATAVWKIAPALAFGNAVIWKPANLVPASAVALAEIMARQDIPKGLFNLVMGPGGAVGQQLAESPLINAISSRRQTNRSELHWQPDKDPIRNGVKKRPRCHGRCGSRPCCYMRTEWRFWRYRSKMYRFLTTNCS